MQLPIAAMVDGDPHCPDQRREEAPASWKKCCCLGGVGTGCELVGVRCFGRGGGGKHPRPARRLRRLRGSNSGRHSSNRREEADVSVFLPEWCGLGIQPTTHRPVQIAARRIKRRLR